MGNDSGVLHVLSRQLSLKNLPVVAPCLGLKLSWLEGLDAGLPKSDLVIVLDVPQNESFKRKRQNRDKFEKNAKFSQTISRTYRKLAKKKRWKIIDATQSKDDVHQDIMRVFSRKIGI